MPSLHASQGWMPRAMWSHSHVFSLSPGEPCKEDFLDGFIPMGETEASSWGRNALRVRSQGRWNWASRLGLLALSIGHGAPLAYLGVRMRMRLGRSWVRSKHASQVLCSAAVLGKLPHSEERSKTRGPFRLSAFSLHEWEYSFIWVLAQW